MTDSTLLTPFKRFARIEAAGGIVLMFCAVAAMVIANSPLAHWYHHFFEQSVSFSFGNFQLSNSVHHWINDGLMAIFFFLVGLEIKRELLVGELSSVDKAFLPVIAAIGGMVVPVVIFLLMNGGLPGEEGWGIPMATDIAFSLGVLSLLGKRVPLSLKIFLTAFAIVDDIGAVLVIALFYSSHIAVSYLLYILGLVIVLIVLNRLKYNGISLYIAIGVIIWFFMLQSGIHATLAGVIVAFTIPANPKLSIWKFVSKIHRQLHEFSNGDQTDEESTLTHHQLEIIDGIEEDASNVQSPLQFLEHRLHKWITFFIMPLFAFANAGVTIFGGEDTASMGDLTISIFVALLLGKLLGIFLFSILAIKAKWVSFPDGMDYKSLFGLSLLGGVGFTMSLFIGDLSFSDMELVNQAKIGIIAASLVAGLLGYLVLNYALKKTKQ